VIQIHKIIVFSNQRLYEIAVSKVLQCLCNDDTSIWNNSVRVTVILAHEITVLSIHVTMTVYNMPEYPYISVHVTISVNYDRCWAAGLRGKKKRI